MHVHLWASNNSAYSLCKGEKLHASNLHIFIRFFRSVKEHCPLDSLFNIKRNRLFFTNLTTRLNMRSSCNPTASHAQISPFPPPSYNKAPAAALTGISHLFLYQWLLLTKHTCINLNYYYSLKCHILMQFI